MYNLRTNSKKKNDKNNAVMYSAALQDHFLKKNNFNLLDVKTSLSHKIVGGQTNNRNMIQKLPSIQKEIKMGTTEKNIAKM